MSYCFIRQLRRPWAGLCLAAALVGFQACTDQYELDEEGNNPEWLGQSIYAELQNPSSGKLSGTFTNYLRLVDDLGYAETMQRTGSKTVFAANDSAFARFYASNSWGVTKYEDLTTAQKKMLLYSSMLDNALLTEMLSNVESSGSGVTRGLALKHQTSSNVTDTIYTLYGPSQMPANNEYWSPYFDKGIDVVMDNTRPMMVHFTQEQMVNNGITTDGANSDFAIVTGKPYSEGLTFIFKNAIKEGGDNVTCTNGYINQMEDVIVPPGNLAQMLRGYDDTKFFMRMLDRFCAPYYDGTTTSNYNDLAKLNGWAQKDSVFAWRYFSERSQGSSITNAVSLSRDPYGTPLAADEILKFDPGWNQYTSNYGSALADLGAMFVPNDDAVAAYFVGTETTTGGGADIINQYAAVPNTRENLMQNLDSLPLNIVAEFVNNLMNVSFVNTVPSKFGTIMDQASDPLGLEISDIVKDASGSYDVRIANNGVAYMLNRVIPPITYNIVSTPALIEPNFSVINAFIQDKSSGSIGVGLNFYAYLQSSTSNYALFLPPNEAFNEYYVDPASLAPSSSGVVNPRVLHFYYVGGSTKVKCSSWRYQLQDGKIVLTDSIGELSVSSVKTQAEDILNYHTVALEQGETFGTNHYYKTKHGGAIYVDKAAKGGHVMGGAQIDNGLAACEITDVRDYSKSNGMTYVIDHIIQAPQNSVYATLKNVEDQRFSKFIEFCEGFTSSDGTELMEWAWETPSEATKAKSRLAVFKSQDGSLKTIDYMVNFFNTFNYTVYAPDNDAMDEAYSRGLPTWEDVLAVRNGEGDKDKVMSMINEMSRFVRYHVQDNSVFADVKVDSASYQTSCSYGATGAYQKLSVKGGDGKFTVTDNYGTQQTIDANGSLLVNKMARDYKFSGNSISTSSFATVHEIAHPLNYRTDTQRYDGEWN